MRISYDIWADDVVKLSPRKDAPRVQSEPTASAASNERPDVTVFWGSADDAGEPCPAFCFCARLLAVATLSNEATRLIEDLRDEDVDWLVQVLRKRTEERAVPVSAALSRDKPVPDKHSGTATAATSAEILRWPHLGPAAVGAALILGWLAGMAAGPLVTILGAVLGLLLGDRLDQHTAAAADA